MEESVTGVLLGLLAPRTMNQLLPALGQGQLQVGSCSDSIACFNAMQRGVDLRIVADLSSGGGPSPRSDSVAIVVRKDLWDAGTIREPQHLVGRQLYNIAGDPRETRNLAKQRPELVERLSRRIDAWWDAN